MKFFLSFFLLSIIQLDLFAQENKSDSILTKRTDLFALGGIGLSIYNTQSPTIPFFSLGLRRTIKSNKSGFISLSNSFLNGKHSVNDTIVYSSLEHYDFTGRDLYIIFLQTGLNHKLLNSKNKFDLYLNYSLDIYFARRTALFGNSILGKSKLENPINSINWGLTTGLIFQYKIARFLVLSANLNVAYSIRFSPFGIGMTPIAQLGCYFKIK
jgi:hypothetical protein